MLKYLMRWYRTYQETRQEKKRDREGGIRIWCPGCKDELTAGSPPIRVRQGHVTDHYMCQCGCVSHWFMGAPIAIVLGYTHWRHSNTLEDPNWGKAVPIRAHAGTLYYNPPTSTHFIYTTFNELLAFPPGSLPHHWHCLTPIELYPGLIIAQPDDQSDDLIFNGHHFGKVSKLWVKHANLKNARPTTSNVSTD